MHFGEQQKVFISNFTIQFSAQLLICYIAMGSSAGERYIMVLGWQKSINGPLIKFTKTSDCFK